MRRLRKAFRRGSFIRALAVSVAAALVVVTFGENLAHGGEACHAHIGHGDPASATHLDAGSHLNGGADVAHVYDGDTRGTVNDQGSPQNSPHSSVAHDHVHCCAYLAAAAGPEAPGVEAQQTAFSLSDDQIRQNVPDGLERPPRLSA